MNIVMKNKIAPLLAIAKRGVTVVMMNIMVGHLISLSNCL